MNTSVEGRFYIDDMDNCAGHPNFDFSFFGKADIDYGLGACRKLRCFIIKHPVLATKSYTGTCKKN